MPGEQGAHHHSLNTGSDVSNESAAVPDVFSIIAQESLLDALQPAFIHFTKVAAYRFPAHLGWLYRFSDEIYLMLDTYIQYHSITKHGGSFSEYFYGMKRVTEEGSKTTGKLTILNLIILVGYVYVKRKLESLYDYLSVQAADGHLSSNDTFTRLRRGFIAVYPYVHSVWTGTLFTYFIRFLLGYTKTHSPLLKLCRVRLAPHSLDDVTEESTILWSDVYNHSGLLAKVKFLMSQTATSLPHLTYQAFSMSVFFLQFLQWYSSYEEGEGESESFSTAQNIPAPPTPQSEGANKLLCPICMKTRTNSTAVSTSGYVFCYPCIYRYIKQHNKCPVTGFKASMDNLIKLYMPE